jgi:hypothetical protein
MSREGQSVVPERDEGTPARGDVVLHPRWESLEQLIATKQASPEGLRIDLGSGYAKPQGFVGLDNLVGARAQIPDEENAPDVLCDLNRDPFPFPDESVQEVRSSHFMEHSVLDHVIDESHRVLVRGGIKHFAVPYANSAEGMYPGHQIFLTERWFYENLNFQAKFEILEEHYLASEDWEQLPRIVRRLLPFEIARKHLFNVCRQMTIIARVRK